MNRRTLLVTGAGGFVGSWISKLGAETDWDVSAIVRPGAGVDAVTPSPCRIHRADILDASCLSKIVCDVRPTHVIHAAFAPGYPASPDARRRMLDTAATGTTNLIEAIALAGSVEHYVHVGSSTEYGPSDTPHRVTDPLHPVSFRGAVKAAAWLIARGMSQTLGIKSSNVRLFSVYGPWEQPGRLVPRLMSAARIRAKVSITATPKLRNWIYAADAARACLAALSRDGKQSAEFNACGDVHSTHELAIIVEEITGRSVVQDFNYPDQNAYGDNQPYAEASGPTDGLQWRPMVSLHDGLRHSWEWACTPAGRTHWSAA